MLEYRNVECIAHLEVMIRGIQINLGYILAVPTKMGV